MRAFRTGMLDDSASEAAGEQPVEAQPVEAPPAERTGDRALP
jgi:hypothetical protein